MFRTVALYLFNHCSAHSEFAKLTALNSGRSGHTWDLSEKEVNSKVLCGLSHETYPQRISHASSGKKPGKHPFVGVLLGKVVDHMHGRTSVALCRFLEQT